MQMSEWRRERIVLDIRIFFADMRMVWFACEGEDSFIGEVVLGSYDNG